MSGGEQSGGGGVSRGWVLPLLVVVGMFLLVIAAWTTFYLVAGDVDTRQLGPDEVETLLEERR